MTEKLTKEECFAVLDRYKNWNHGQKSVSFLFRGIHTDEDKVYDERRKLILAATKRLKELAE